MRDVLQSHAPEEADPDYVADYTAQGHSEPVAQRMAIAYEATENAIEAGDVVPATKQKPVELFPDRSEWEIKLRRLCADIKSAAGQIDRANINDLKKASTRKQIASAHAKWIEQIERIENFHPNFYDEVAKHEA